MWNSIEGDQLHGFHCSDPNSCGGVDGADMYKFTHGPPNMHVGVLVIGDGMSMLMGHLSWQLDLYSYLYLPYSMTLASNHVIYIECQ